MMNTGFIIPLILAFGMLFSTFIPVTADESTYKESYKVDGNAFFSGKYINLFLHNGLNVPNVMKDSRYHHHITRAELCELMVAVHCKLNKIDKKDIALPKNPFTDTDNTDVRIIHSLGIMKEISEGKFAPEKRITRQEFASVMIQFLHAQKVNTDSYNLSVLGRFRDRKDLDEQYANEFAYLVEHGMMQGRRQFFGQEFLLPTKNVLVEDAITSLGSFLESRDYKAKRIDFCHYSLPLDTELKGDDNSAVDYVCFWFPPSGNEARMLQDFEEMLKLRFPKAKQSSIELAVNAVKTGREQAKQPDLSEDADINVYETLDTHTVHIIKEYDGVVYVYIFKNLK